MALTKVIGAGAEGLTLSSTSLTVANGLTLTDGNVTLANGHGINFAATGDASGGGMASELFDDYEQGTWTPTASAGLSGFTIQRAYYTKVGRLVEVNVYLSGITGKDSNQLLLSGLPFTSADGYATGPMESASNGHMGMARVQASTTNVIFYYPNTSTSLRTNFLGDDLGSHIIFSIVYMTA